MEEEPRAHFAYELLNEVIDWKETIELHHMYALSSLHLHNGAPASAEERWAEGIWDHIESDVIYRLCGKSVSEVSMSH